MTTPQPTAKRVHHKTLIAAARKAAAMADIKQHTADLLALGYILGHGGEREQCRTIYAYTLPAYETLKASQGGDVKRQCAYSCTFRRQYRYKCGDFFLRENALLEEEASALAEMLRDARRHAANEAADVAAT